MKTFVYSNFFEAMPEEALIVEADFSVHHINRSACKYHEIDKESAKRKKCYELFGEKEKCQNCPLSEVIQIGNPVEKEIYREKAKTWHSIRAFLISDKDETPRVGIITKDITSSKTAERVLVDFNYKIKKFINRMPIGCILWDEDFKVSMWNPAAEQIFGYTENEVRGMHPYDVIVPSDMIPETEPVKQKLQKGDDSSNRTGENITKSGQRIYCSWLNTPVQGADGKTIAILSMVQDITHERNMQSQTIRAAQLASIGQITANVAHEINNPISGVINYSQILLNGSEKLDEKQIDIIGRINKEGERVAGIVKSLLNFARKSADTMEPHDVRSIVMEAVALLKPAINKSGVSMTMDFMEGATTVKCNPQQVEQVLINVVKNAVDALHDSSNNDKIILITTATRQNGDQKELILSIANNGPHIPFSLQEKIFEPFMTTKGHGAGTGLGLGISLEIMKNHGGTIRLNSASGEMTEMQLVFPV